MASPDEASGAAGGATARDRGVLADLPADALIVIPVRNVVLFPGLITPLVLNRARAIAAAQDAVRTQRPIGLLLQREPETETPGPRDLYTVGTVATILRYVTGPEGTHNLVCHGQSRFRLAGFVPDM